MRRKSESIFLLIERTVPMLIAIGAVLSVLSLLFPASSGWRIAALIAWFVVAATAGTTFVFFLISKKNPFSSVEKEEEMGEAVLSEVAHELKTPLTVIRGSAEALADGAIPPEAIPEYCARIVKSCDGMGKLVSDLLDATRPEERFRLDKQKTNLICLSEAVCADMQISATAAGLTLTCVTEEDLPLLLLDPDRVGQLMMILLDNAVKHTPEGGKISVTVGKKGKYAAVTVSDTGHGIDPKDLPHVFERFYRAPQERGGLTTGNGIGLSVAEKIVRLHGGTIEVKSKIGKGTVFTVRFPLP